LAYHFENYQETVASEQIAQAMADPECLSIRLADCQVVGGCDDRNVLSCQAFLACRVNFDGVLAFSECTFLDKVSFSECTFLDKVSFTLCTFRDTVSFDSCSFRTLASFCDCTFYAPTSFANTRFSAEAQFSRSTFGDVQFDGARFESDDYNGARFEDVTIWWRASFAVAWFKRPGLFKGVRFRPDTCMSTCMSRLRNMSLLRNWFGPSEPQALSTARDSHQRLRHPDPSRHDVPRQKGGGAAGDQRRRGEATKAERSATQFWLSPEYIDSSNDPLFRRYIADHEFLRANRERYPFWAGVWRWTCDYGRSWLLWSFWALVIPLLFGLVYAPFSCPTWLAWEPSTSILAAMDPELRMSADTVVSNWFAPYYFSIVAFTTLGFGDITPANSAAQVWVTLEVILGYFMLGGLISIFASKVTRRG